MVRRGWVPAEKGKAFRSGAAMGALIMAWAGGAWAILALIDRSAALPWTVAATALPVLVLTVAAVARVRAIARIVEVRAEAETERAARQGRRAGLIFGIVFGVEVALILGSAILLTNAGQDLLIPVAIVAIVGAHFLPLARAFLTRTYGTVGIVLMVLACGSLTIPDQRLRDFLLGLATAVVFWVGAGMVLATET